MVLGEVLLEYPDHYTYNNLFHTRIQDIDLRGDSVKNLLFDQSGRDYSCMLSGIKYIVAISWKSAFLIWLCKPST